jgi:hypothetical protein
MKLRTLLVVLLLAVIALPNGITVCLRKLGGESVAGECCASCCTKETPSRTQPVVTTGHCAHCCLSTPPSERSLAPSTQKAPSAELAAPPALTLTLCDPRPAVFQLASCADHGRSPPRGSPALPLRI